MRGAVGIRNSTCAVEQVDWLLVDDDRVALMALRRGISKLGLSPRVLTATDGQDALSQLRARIGTDDRDRPVLVLLDLNMPRMTGIEFLDAVRADPDLRRLPVFVVTTSNTRADVRAAWDRNVAGYVVKSDLGGGLMDAIDMMQRYISSVELAT